MNDTERRLRSDAGTWQIGLEQAAPTDARADIDGAVVGLGPQPSRRRRSVGPRLAIATAAVVVAAVALGGIYLGRDHHRAPTADRRTSTTAVTETDVAGIALRHPSAWRYVESDAGRMSAGPAQTVGYLTDQAVTLPECTTKATGAYQCQPAIRHLEPGGIVVTIERTELQPALTPTRTIAGLPATVVRDSSDTACGAYPAAAHSVDAQLQTKPPTLGNRSNSRLVITACAAAPVSARTRQDIETMLDTATSAR